MDSEPWWQVDLDVDTTIGTIKIWNRQPETNVDDIQSISINSASVIGGVFSLQINHASATTITQPIFHDAVAMIRDEVSGGSDGNGDGESIQAKLQGLDNIGVVTVTRSLQKTMGGFTWTVTVSENYNLDI